MLCALIDAMAGSAGPIAVRGRKPPATYLVPRRLLPPVLSARTTAPDSVGPSGGVWCRPGHARIPDAKPPGPDQGEHCRLDMLR